MAFKITMKTKAIEQAMETSNLDELIAQEKNFDLSAIMRLKPPIKLFKVDEPTFLMI